jgi:hypothetical protein
MHAMPWQMDILFGALVLLTSWQTYAVGAFVVAGIVLWIKKHKRS